MAIGGPGAATALASASIAPRNSLTLESQSPAFVANQNGVNLGIAVRSKQPASRLELEVTLFSKVGARFTFRQTLSGIRNHLVQSDELLKQLSRPRKVVFQEARADDSM